MTRLALILLIWWALLAPVALVKWLVRKHHERLENKRAYNAYRFWRGQCNLALAGMKKARTDAEYAKWNEAMRVNMRRYEKEVLGR